MNPSDTEFDQKSPIEFKSIQMSPSDDRRCVAIRVHTMMLDITRARQSANLVECEGDADRGSDLGDDFDSDCCDSANEDTCTDSDNEHTSACIDNLDDELTRDDPL